VAGIVMLLSGCGTDVGREHGGGGGSGGGVGGNGAGDLGGSGGSGGGGAGGSGGAGGAGGGGTTYTIYAHSDTTLYTVDTVNKMLNPIGNFNAPTDPKTKRTDVIQDLAITPDNTIYVVGKTTLYTADPKDGHVTVVGAVGSLGACGTDNVALTTTPDNKLYVADYGGAFCEIDVTVSPPTIHQIGTLGNNMAVSGDIVGLGDGSIYATAYNKSNSATQLSNVLVKLDPKSGAIISTQGPTGYPKLFGVAFADGKVYGFTHDGSGDVIVIDPKTGAGTIFATFKDSGGGISFAGAGVNSDVPAPPIS
jgi:hypothetical protein